MACTHEAIANSMHSGNHFLNQVTQSMADNDKACNSLKKKKQNIKCTLDFLRQVFRCTKIKK